MKKYLTAILTFIASSALWFGFFSLPASASTPAYNPSYLISDKYFTDSGSMTTSQIQSFLNGKNSGIKNLTATENCSTIQTPYSYTYYPNCGKKVSAATIIYDAGRAYGISQKAILATLQKEQSLVTDPSPTQAAINCAMGYNSCSGFSGFFSQVDNGTWQFRTYIELMNGRSWWGYDPSTYPCKNGHDVDSSNDLYSTGLYPGRTVTFYDSGGTAKTIRLDNSSTAALYCYTPYVGPLSETGYSGSYNFVISYEEWWGSTIFAWAADVTNQDFYSTETDCDNSTNPITLSGATFRTGQQYFVRITATNTGSQTWSSSFVRLGTVNPYNHYGMFDDGSWPSGGRPAYLNETSVAPNDQGTFGCFSVTATPTVDGHYTESYQLVAENKAWLSDNASFALGMQISNPYNATVTSIGTYDDSGHTQPTDPHVMTYGQKIYVRVKAKNIGSQTWTNSFMKIGTTDPSNRSSAFCDSSWPSCGRPAIMTESSVAPGQTGTFDFVMKAPSTANSYAEDFGLVAESQSYGWTPNGTFSLPTKVVSPPLDTIYPGERIFTGESITSKSGRYTLDLQSDGNLVIYGDGRALWASWTAGKSASYLAMQDDGNLVLYSTSGRPIWYTHTAGQGSSSLQIQSDGNLVIYNSKSTATWASHTWQAASMATSTNSLGSSGAQVLNSSQPLNSSSGKYQLVLQSDGNLVLYSGGHASWASWTNGKPVDRLVLQSDGNLVLYGSDNRAYWSSKSAGRGDNANLILQDDGNLVLYSSSNQAIWSAL